MTAQDNVIGLHKFSVPIEVTVRQLQKSDLPKLEWYGQFKHYRHLFRRSYRGQLDGSRLLLVADMNNFPIGRMFIQFRSPKSRVSDGRSKAYLYSFTVMELFRGYGIGTRLLHVAEAILRKRQFQYATIAVAKDNEGALRLYQREGYAIYSEDEGKWSYYDHKGQLNYVHEPCWLLKKHL